MVGLEQFSRVVSQLHASAGVPTMWEPTLAELAGHLEATACTVTIGSGRDRTILSTGIRSDAIDAYADYFHHKDFIMKACETGPVGLVRGGWDLVARNKKTEFHADWQRRFEMTDGLQVRLSASPFYGLLLSAPPRSQPYETAERVRFLNALVPHLQQTLRTRERLADSNHHPVDVGGSADVIRHAVFTVAAGGRVVQMNSAAQQLALAGDGLTFPGGTVGVGTAETNSELQAAVAKALVRQGNKIRIGSYLVCGRPSGKRPYVIRVIPLDAADDPCLARAAIVVIDPEREFKPPKALLQNLFHLSDAESEVALRMLNGDGLKAIADSLLVSISTVKTHVQRIFQKTGTHRQAELVRLLIVIVS